MSTSRSSSTVSVISAPRIDEAIPNGQVQITAGGIGGFPAKEANNLVTVLKFGSLPFPVKELSSEQIIGDARRGVPEPEPDRRA